MAKLVSTVRRPRSFGAAISAEYTAAGELLKPIVTPGKTKYEFRTCDGIKFQEQYRRNKKKRNL
jgi:hypothetical protein